MNKIDEAWALLKSLPADRQQIAAEAILDFAADTSGLQLSREQLVELEHRLKDTDAATLSLDEFRSRVRKLVC